MASAMFHEKLSDHVSPVAHDTSMHMDTAANETR
jgi:hypothetical protein